nr:hypothetical protein JVH1_1144 [Rhodococcus sp. JVH1]
MFVAWIAFRPSLTLLTDNSRTVTIDRIAGVPVRHPDIVFAGNLLLASRRIDHLNDGRRA